MHVVTARARTALSAAAPWLAILGLLGLVWWGVQVARPTGELRDYGSFVASGRAGAQGENPYGVHPLTFHVRLPGVDLWNPNLNPPISVLLFRLFDRVDPATGFRIWWSLSLVAYVAAVMLLVRRYGAGPMGLVALWAVAHAGLWDTLALGQIYLPLVLGVVGAWLQLDRGRPWIAGVMIGAVVAMKPNLALWPAMLLLAGHYRAPLSAALTASALSVLPIVTHGAEVYRQWVDLVVSDRGRVAFLTNASLPGLVERVAGRGLGLAVAAAVTGALVLWVLKRRPSPLHASAIGLIGAILASPIAWVHYTLFLLPIFFAARPTLPIAVSAAMMLVPVPQLLQLLDAPTWQRVSAGSVYTWAVIACLAAMLRPAADPFERRRRPATAVAAERRRAAWTYQVAGSRT